MKSKMSSSVLAILLVCFGSYAFAQAPLLAIATPIKMTRTLPNGRSYGYWLVPVTNNYHAAVTALAIDFNGHVPGRGILDFRDSIPNPDPLFPALGPFATATIQVPARGSAPPVAVNKAVIYADGATAGDAKIIAHFLLARALTLAAIPPTVARLSAIAADPGADRGAVVVHFQRQESIVRDVLKRDGYPWGNNAPVADMVWSNVKYRPKDNLQQMAAHLGGIFQKWRIKLETSKPKLATIPFPASGS